MKNANEPWRLMRLPEVMRMTARSASAIYADINACKFPKPLRIGRNSVAWISIEVEAWIAQKVDERNRCHGKHELQCINRKWFGYVDSIPLGSRLLRRPEVEERTGKSRASIYAEIKEGIFPAPVRLSNNAVAWLESEVNEFIGERLEQRKKTIAARGVK